MCNFCDTHMKFNFLFEGFSRIVEIGFLPYLPWALLAFLQPLLPCGPWQDFLDHGVCLGLDLYFVSKFRFLEIERISVQKDNPSKMKKKKLQKYFFKDNFKYLFSHSHFGKWVRGSKKALLTSSFSGQNIEANLFLCSMGEYCATEESIINIW